MTKENIRKDWLTGATMAHLFGYFFGSPTPLSIVAVLPLLRRFYDQAIAAATLFGVRQHAVLSPSTERCNKEKHPKSPHADQNFDFKRFRHFDLRKLPVPGTKRGAILYLCGEY